MKVLIVNYNENEGGAARAANRLYLALNKVNINCKMLVVNQNTNDFNIISLKGFNTKLKNFFKGKIDSFRLKSFYTNYPTSVFSISTFNNKNLVKRINDEQPDIVHLHWLNRNMLSIEDLTSINAPMLWSFHDMWAFTGGCHYTDFCNKFQKSCGKCIQLSSSKENDLSRKVYNRKKKVYSQLDGKLYYNALSKWIQREATNSSLLKGKTVYNLPNPIDLKSFKSIEKSYSRKLWNLSNRKQYILFGAMSSTSDTRKGFLELTSALKLIDNKENIELIVFGSNEPKEPLDLGYEISYVGVLKDDQSLVSLFNSVDVMVVPSLQENLSNAIMESISCHTPVVAFNIGGNSDLINHKRNGYLAKPNNIEDLKEGIEWVLSNYDNLIEYDERQFDEIKVAHEYLDLYKTIIEKYQKSL